MLPGRSFVCIGMTLLAMTAKAMAEDKPLPVGHNNPKSVVAPPPHQPIPHQPVPPVAPQTPPHQPTAQVTPQPPPHTPAPKVVDVQVPPSPSVLKLKTDIAALTVTLNKYIKAGNQVDLDLTVVITGIDAVVIINTDLTNIDQDSALLRDLLGVAKQVPALKDQASLLLSELERAKPAVKDAQKVSSEASVSLIPIRNRLNTIDKVFRTLVKTAERLETALGLYSAALLKIQQCADALPQGEIQKSIQHAIDNRANEIDPYVVKANDDLIQIINDINAIERSIQNDMKQTIEPLHNLEKEVDAVSRKLHALVKPLRELEALFKKEFSAEFPYPSPTLEDPFRFKHHKFAIGFHLILKGEKAVEREIEKILSDELYRAAKIFGLEKLIREIERDGMKEFDAIKGRLSMDFPVDVPGLKTISMSFDAFKKDLLNIQMPNINAQSVEDLLDKIQGEISKLNAMLPDCHKK